MATIAYADVLDAALLPIDAQNIITRVRLVIAGSRAGVEPDVHYVSRDAGSGGTDGTRYDYYPNPVIYEYEDALHATYAATRSLALPEGINPFLDPTDESIPEPTVSGFVNAGDPSAVRDGDSTTYATVTGAGSIQYANVEGGVGFRLRANATVTGGTHGLTAFVRNQRGASSALGFVATASKRVTAADATDLYIILPPDARNATENTADLDGLAYFMTANVTTFSGSAADVYHFYPLILNEPLLEDIAKANIRLPAAAPQRVTVRGYIAPDRTHTITGWPGGDYTGTVAQVQYEVDRTVIDFEQAGSPVGLPAEAIEAARAQRVATQSVVDTAGYGLKMGERQ